MNKEETIYSIRAEWGNNTSGIEQLCQAVWNAAIEMATEQSKPIGSNYAPVGTIYKYDPKSNRFYWVDKESITSLKFKTDEK